MILLLAACSSPEMATPTSSPITVALNWYPEPEFGGLYQAQIDGTFAARQLDVTFQSGGPGAPVIQQVATGRVQFGISMADEVVLAKAQGADVVTIFATYQTHPLGIMVHASRGLTDLAGLTSGTLAVEDGIPFAQYLFAKYDWKDITRVPYGGGVTQWLLDPSYAQQVYVTSEPIVAKQQGGDPQVFMVADTGYNPYANVVITSGRLIAEQPALVQAFVDAIEGGWGEYLKDGTKANAKIHELNPTMSDEVLKASWDAQKPLITGGHAAQAGVGAMEAERWATLVRQLTEIGALKTPVDPNSLFTNQFVGP